MPKKTGKRPERRIAKASDISHAMVMPQSGISDMTLSKVLYQSFDRAFLDNSSKSISN